MRYISGRKARRSARWVNEVWVMRTQVFQLVVVVLAALALGTMERSTLGFVAPDERELMVKHLWQAQSKGGWKVETWVNASFTPAYDPVHLLIRITPNDPKKAEKPKAQVRLKLILKTDRKQLYEAKTSIDWQLCSTMKQRREMTYDAEKREFGPELDFPPKEKCWEAEFKHGFHYKKSANRVLPGEYELHTDVSIEGGPTFQLAPKVILIKKRT
jgi:hypothetical protein